MEYELKRMLLIICIVFFSGGFLGLFNLLIGVVFISAIVGYIVITVFWKDLFIALLKFLLTFFPKTRAPSRSHR
jgi:uncharacterized membrane protein